MHKLISRESLIFLRSKDRALVCDDPIPVDESGLRMSRGRPLDKTRIEDGELSVW